MKLTLLTLLLAILFTTARAQCDIGTTGVAVMDATGTTPVSTGCVGQVYNFRFTVANYGSSPDCELTANTVHVYFDFPTISGGIKPYIYNGPASFTSGYFTWTYDSFFEELVGVNTTAIPFGEGDADILVQVIGNAAGTASSPLNIAAGPNSNNPNNDFASAQLSISALPVVSWPAPANQCLSSTSYTLTGGSPSGGTYSGPGVTGNNFNAAAVGAGTYTLTYSYTSAGGCANSVSNPITVFALPLVSAGSYGPVCSNAAPVTLSGTPAGGSWSGTGVTGNSFDPSVGTQTLTYTYSNGTCSNSATTTITVNPAPVVTTGSYGPVCSNAAPVTLSGTPAGGTWSGTGVTGNSFSPSAGTQTLTYTYNNGSCTATAATTITVNPVPVVSFTGLASTYCSSDAPVLLNGSPAGGTFTGPGITGNQFNPAAAGVGGPYTIAYTYSNGAGCTSSSFQQVSVTNCVSFATLNLKVFLEGSYIGGSAMRSTLFDLGIDPDPTATDSITVNLWSPSGLSNPGPDYSVVVLLHNNGVTSVQFPSAVIGSSWYIAVKHRNSIETWSRNPIAFTANNNYDFTTGLVQAFEDGVNPPMTSVEPAVYAIYSGDVNQDGGIDASDMAIVDNDNNEFAFGYNPSDATGDGGTDASDIAIVDNNQQLFLFFARPY